MSRLAAWIPQGRLVPDEIWRRRHRFFVALALLHVPAIVAFAIVTGHPTGHGLEEALVVGVPAVLAASSRLGRTARTVLVSLSLLIASAVLVHLSGGTVEMHFHFFIVVPLLALYQDWVPFLLAIGFVVLHHFVIGTLDPASVFDHPGGREDPLLWSLVHGTYIAALSGVSLVGWRQSQQAFRDPLTDLASRSLFQVRLEEALAADDDGRPGPAVLFIDVDDFKTINDSLGHAVGDGLLAAAAGRIRSAMRRSDTVARLGGDEFGILLPAGSEADARALAERILRLFRDPFLVDGNDLRVHVSIGVTTAARSSTVALDVLRDADTAMYAAKANGKDRYEIFVGSMHEAALHRLMTRDELQAAIDRRELFLEYQPIVDLGTRQAVGVEALVRWRHPVRGVVSPMEFVPIAEETGLIVEIGQWVIREACRQAAAWSELPALGMSVNLSVRHLQHPDVLDHVAGALAASELAPGRLTIEITESVLMDDVAGSRRTLAALRALGVRLAIDDFGTGHSSLAQLRLLPVDVLKIDRSFVDELDDGQPDAQIPGVIVQLAEILGLETVAEGVERPSQVDALAAAGCGTAQGFIFARPMAPDRIPALCGRGWAAGPLETDGAPTPVRPSRETLDVLPTAITPARRARRRRPAVA